MKIIIDGTVESLRTRQDGSVVFSLATQEMDADNCGKLFQLRNKYVKCLLSDTNISSIEEKLVDQEPMAGGKKPKSPSQRLRGAMFRAHESQQIPIDFELWYKGEMERIIEGYKELINQ